MFQLCTIYYFTWILLFTIKILNEYERGVIFFLGVFKESGRESFLIPVRKNEKNDYVSLQWTSHPALSSIATTSFKVNGVVILLKILKRVLLQLRITIRTSQIAKRH